MVKEFQHDKKYMKEFVFEPKTTLVLISKEYRKVLLVYNGDQRKQSFELF